MSTLTRMLQSSVMTIPSVTISYRFEGAPLLGRQGGLEGHGVEPSRTDEFQMLDLRRCRYAKKGICKKVAALMFYAGVPGGEPSSVIRALATS